MYRRGCPLSRPTALGPPFVRSRNSQCFVQAQTENEEELEDVCVTSSELSLIEDFGEVLDLSQSNTDCQNASQTSTQTETGETFQLSPDLFPPEDAPLSITSTPKHTESFESSTKTSAQAINNNLVKSGALTKVIRRLLSKLAPTVLTEPNVNLYECTTPIQHDQMSCLCRMTATSLSDKWEVPKESTSSGALSKMVREPTRRNLTVDLSSSRLKPVLHSRQEQVLADVERATASDFSDSGNINEEKLVIEPAQLDLVPLPLPAASPDIAEASVSSTQLCLVQCRGQKRHLDAQPTLPVKSVSRDTPDADLEFDDTPSTIAENNNRTLLINNIDIYKHIDRGATGKYELNGVPFLYVIFTGIITSKLATQNNITELEVDDGTAVVRCLFDDTMCFPEHRTSFHKFLDSCKHNLPLFRRDAEFNEAFLFMREYGKRLFQETPQSDDLMMGDEVTVVGKVFDCTNDERVVYHKFLWRNVDLAFRQSRDYVQEQFARQGRHF